MATRTISGRQMRRRQPIPAALPHRAATGLLQRSPLDQGRTGLVPPLVGEALRSPGRLLDPSVRAFMEPRLGFDFSQVRIHTDALAAESARQVRARAFTLGQDIVFGAGRYAPHTEAGRRLLAHELTHVVQQGGAMPPMRHPAGVGPAGQQQAPGPDLSQATGVRGSDPLERAAESAADRLASGSSPGLAFAGAAAGLQRAEDTGKDQPSEDTCAKQENDPESFSIMAAKHFLNEVDPSPSRLVQSATCEAAGPDGDRMECDVTFSDGQKIHVTWIKSLNNVEAQRPTKDDRQWCVYHYVCNPDGTIDYQKKGCSANAGGMPPTQSGPTMVGAAAGGSGPGGRA